MLAYVIAIIIWASIAYYLYKNRIWIFYYIWAAVGMTIIAILLLRGSPVEYAIEQWTGLILHYSLGLVGIKTMVFDKSPGTVLVLLALENSWTCIDIDIECSGLLESCVLLGLLLFFPIGNRRTKIFQAVAGLAALYSANLVRLYTIVAIINIWGRNAMYIAHTLIGRLVFFILAVIIYWYLFTRPTLGDVRKKGKHA
ncbi:MAG: exosortase family protein XrtG [Syntrophomonadaceae bacterium]|nr:exosortase family protein XrtG [Syntrophomonadaceae bacterium]